MDILENFFTSPTDVKARPGFEEETLSRVLAAYQKSLLRGLLKKISLLLPIPIAVAFSFMIFLRPGIIHQAAPHREPAVSEKETQDVESQITNDPVINEALSLPN